MVSTTIKRALGMGAIALSLTGCVVNKELVPTGGSRSDGTVVLSYTYGLFEQPKIDAVQGQQSAAQRCRAWGYSEAEAFGGSTQQCLSHDMYGSCTMVQVNVQYQCIGADKPQ